MSFINLSEIGYGDTSALDAFGRLRVSEPTTLFDSVQEYGFNTTILWDATANGTIIAPASDGSVVNGANSVGPRDPNTRMTPVTVSTTNGHYSLLQSRQYVRYTPGKSQFVLLAGVMAAGPGAAVSIVQRSSTSGAPVDTVHPQASWNVDKFDGTGPSGAILDFTKTQILTISIGGGRVNIGFYLNGRIWAAHYIQQSNLTNIPLCQTFNLPVRFELRNTGVATCVSRVGYFEENNGVFLQCSRSTNGGTITMDRCAVQTEGGEQVVGLPRTVSNGTTTIGVTSRRPVLSIRPKLTFNGLTNRAFMTLEGISLFVKTNDAFFEIVFGGTLTGAAFASASPTAVSEFDTAATAITGGAVIFSGFGAAGSGSVAASASLQLDTRSPLTLRQIDGLAASQDPLTIVCTAFSGTSNVSAAINYRERIY